MCAIEGLFSGGEYEYLRGKVFGCFLVSKITAHTSSLLITMLHVTSTVHVTCYMYVCMYYNQTWQTWQSQIYYLEPGNY